LRSFSEQRLGIRGDLAPGISRVACRFFGVSFEAVLAIGNRVWLRLRSDEIQGHARFRATPNPALQRTGKALLFPAAEI
jgi:hypothetical protein